MYKNEAETKLSYTNNPIITTSNVVCIRVKLICLNVGWILYVAFGKYSFVPSRKLKPGLVVKSVPVSSRA